MNELPAVKKRSTSPVLAAALALAGLFGGCAYGGVATLPDGRVLVARNSLLGAARKMYFCKPEGNDLTCVESTSAP
jgi:hypothetical protein